MYEKIDLKTIKKREEGKRGRSSKDEELKIYYRIEGLIKVNDAFVLKEMKKWDFLFLQVMISVFLLKRC